MKSLVCFIKRWQGNCTHKLKQKMFKKKKKPKRNEMKLKQWACKNTKEINNFAFNY